jgi:hypothetical protein
MSESNADGIIKRWWRSSLERKEPSMDIKAPNEGYHQLDVERITESKVMGMKYNTIMRSH